MSPYVLFPLALSGAFVAVLQSNVLSATGPVTVVGVLLVAVFALYVGLVSPRYVVQEIRERAEALEKENAELNATLVRLTEQNGDLKVETIRLGEQVRLAREQVEALRRELDAMRRGEVR